MNKLILLSTAAFLLFTACNPMANKDLSADEQLSIVTKLDSIYSHHIEKQQADSLIHTFLSDAILLTPSEAEVNGINAIKDWYSNAFEYGLKSVKYYSSNVTGDENYIIEVGKSIVGLQIGDADTLSYENYKYLHVWIKQPNGQYKLSRDMWNQDQAR
jgi:ketosteroid isomerase-like protein